MAFDSKSKYASCIWEPISSLSDFFGGAGADGGGGGVVTETVAEGDAVPPGPFAVRL